MFKHIFGGSSRQANPSREDWPAISLYITKELEDVRKEWFGWCVRTFEKAADSFKQEKDMDYQIEVKNKHLSGEAELAIKAYQLFLASGFIAKHKYISQQEGKYFADLLYAQVCGTQLEECLPYFHHYLTTRESEGHHVYFFLKDVANYITGNQATLVEVTFIQPIFLILVDATCLAIAYAFGDEETSKEIRERLEKQMPKKER